MGFPVSVVAIVMALFTLHAGDAATVTVHVDTSKAIHEVGEKFLGITLDATHIHDHWTRVHLDDAGVRAMTKALSPSIIRVGGTPADTLTFESGHQSHPGVTMTADDWDKLHDFVTATNLSLVFGLNVLKRHGQNWDSSNARQLLDYSQRKGYHLEGLELGNEPDIFGGQHNASVSPTQLVHDFQDFRKVLHDFPHYRSTSIIGPDVTMMKGSHGEYMMSFLKSGGGQAVDVVTLHHYYMDGRTATKDKFTDVKTLETLRTELQHALDAVSAHAHGKPFWLGETSSAYKGGVHGMSDRYIAGFMWLDKLGMAASMGVQGVLRQGLFGGTYSLLTYGRTPNPDYWVTVLYKQLMGGRVLSVSTSDSSHHVRVYAHCAKNSKGVVMIAMNLNTQSVQLEFPDFHNAPLKLYLLSPEHGDLLTQNIELNGKVLAMNGHQLPHMSPSTQHGHVTLPGHQFAFIEVDGASVPACSGTGSHPFG